MSYVGWALPPEERARLLGLFWPAYPDLIAHHVTLAFPAGDRPLPTATEGVIVGEANDGVAVQALVVEIDGSTTRPDGGTFHVTWSLDRAQGVKPVDSNRVIRAQGWRETARVLIRLEPKRFER